MTAPTDTAPAVTTISRLGTLVLLAGPFLAGLDFFIVNVALPTIQKSLGASAGTLELVVAGYGTAYAVLLVLGGRLGDERGRRLMYGIGIAAFTATSLAAGLAPSVPILLAARVLQGASSALMTPQTLATFQSVLRGPARGRAIATYAAAGGLSSVVGQLLGGVLVSTVSWRAIFLVNVPVGILALVLLRRTVPVSRSTARVGVDVRGTVLLGLAIAGLLVPISEGPTLGWPWWTWASLVVCVVSAVLFVRWSARSPHRGVAPLLPLALVSQARSMRRGLPVLILFFVVFGAFMFVFAIAVQDGLGLSPLAAGLAIAPVCVAYFITSFRVPGLLQRFGRRVLTVGLAIEGVGLLALVVIVRVAWQALGGAGSGAAPESTLVAATLSVVALIVVGVGQSLGVGLLFRLVLSEVPSSRPGSAGECS